MYSTHGKGHQKKRESNFIIKKHNVTAKESIKKSRVTKVNLNEAELVCILVAYTLHNFARINLTVFDQNISFS